MSNNDITKINEFLKGQPWMDFEMRSADLRDVKLYGYLDEADDDKIIITFNFPYIVSCNLEFTYEGKGDFISIIDGEEADIINRKYGIIQGNTIFKIANSDIKADMFIAAVGIEVCLIGRERYYNTYLADFKNVIRWEVLSNQYNQEFNLKFISTNSEYRQGIRLAIDVGNGHLEIDGVRAKEVYLWEDTISESVNVKCISEDGLLSIYNVFEFEFDKRKRVMGGTGPFTDLCGMLVEQKNNTFVYRCNDMSVNSNFNNLVFEIEML